MSDPWYIRGHEIPFLFLEEQSLLYVAHVSVSQINFVYRVHSRNSYNILNKHQILLQI
jgi:hypothetical protein